MSKSKSPRREIIEWSIVFAIPLVLIFTGWHAPLAAKIQELVLSTGFLQAEIIPPDQQVVADLDFDLISPEGERVNLQDFQGKTIFLNFWASWCPPCVAEMPNIHDLYKKLDDENIVFVMVSMDHNHSKARSFLSNRGYKFPAFFPVGNVPPIFTSPQIPATFVISPAGNIVAHHVGMANYNTDSFRYLLQNLAKQSR